MLIDSHAHLDNSALASCKSEIIKNLKKDNIKIVVNAGCDLQTSKNSIELSSENSNIFAIIGLHPEYAKEYNDEFEKFLKNNLNNPKVLALGEVGLDYHYENYCPEKQKEVLIKQLKIANEFKIPVAIHLRDAYGDFLKIVEENKHLLNSGMLLHCYSGSIEFANQMLNTVDNVYFAFGGSSTFKNAKNVRETIEQIPLDRILSETDSPFLTPEPFRGKEKNQPKFVDVVVQKIADIKQIQKEKMEDIIEENFYRFFKKIK